MSARRIVLVSILLAVMAGSTFAGLWLNRPTQAETSWGAAPPAVQAVMWPEPRPLARFELQDQHGEPVGPDRLTDRWSLVFFGYLDCPDVCPTSLHAMREMRRHLAEGGGEPPRFVFVSVDPANDTPEDIADYLAWYDPEFIGLHGPAEQVAKLADSMAVKYEEFVDEDGRRSIDHTSSLMIVDPKGRMVGALPPPLQPERMLEQFERLQAHMDHG